MDVVTQYIILKFTLFAILIYTGYGISKKSENLFWLYSIPTIIAYTLIQGLRYARGVDYLAYKYRYEHSSLEKSEWFFKSINHFLNDFLGLPYYWGFMIYSFVLILAVILVLKKYRSIALYALPIFFIISHLDSENLIRQYLAMPFVLLAFLNIMKDKWIKSIFYFWVAISIHLSSVVLLPFIMIFKFVKIPNLSPWYLIGFYLLLVFFWKVEYFGGFASYLRTISLDNKYGSYTENATFWFSDESSLSLRHGTNNINSLIALVRGILYRSTLIYFGMQLVKKARRFQLPFFLWYISVIVLQMGADLEIIMRIGKWFYLFEIFVAGFVLAYTPRKNPYVKYLLLFVIVNYCYTFLSLFLTNLTPKTCSFIWNY